MRKIYFAIPALALIFASLLVPALASAGAFSPYWGPIVSCSGSPQPGSALPQCTSFCDLLVTGQNIVKMAMTIAIYIIAPLFLIWGGVRIMLARGNATEVSDARKMLLSTVIGIAITVGAFIIVNTFFSLIGWTFPTVANMQQSSWSEIRCK
ncbi:MAG: hypothetical protein LiPW15_750 [Parcubacteria group bacterium LiPW_15]|nr:MAG: hypothetical protein LiPW15_750 [Parcubacteria group bacterium LiPW_15]